MLKKFHNKKTKKKIFLILIICIGLPFFLWNTTSFIGRRKASADYGKIFDREISRLEFEDAVKGVEIQSRMQFGEAFYELQKLLDLKRLAIQRLLLLHESKRRKIKVSDAELISSIQNSPLFQRNGRFDKDLYGTIITYGLHLQPRRFEEYFRKDLAVKKLFDSVTNTISLTDQEVEEAYKKENEQLSINYIASIPSDFQKDITPTEEETKDYFSRNSNEFKQPLSFNLEYLRVDSLQKIKNEDAYLDKNETLEKIAKRLNLTIQETGLFSQTKPIPGLGWQEEISNSLTTLKTKEMFPIQKIDNHYYLMRLKERKEPYIPEYQDVKDKAKEVFIQNKARDLAKEKIESCLKKLKDGTVISLEEIDFDKIAKEFVLKSSSTDLFRFGSYIEGIGVSDKIFAIANNLKKGEFSGVIDMPSGFYIVKLKTKVAIDEKKFSEEKEGFSQKLLSQKKNECFSRFSEELFKKNYSSLQPLK